MGVIFFSIIEKSAFELRKLIKRKEVSPVEVVQAFMDRIDALNDHTRAFESINEHALAEAKRAEEEVMNQDELDELHGIPFTIQATPNLNRDKQSEEQPQPTFVKRVKAAGGILLGETTGSQETALNPWTNQPLPIGSSSGSSVAVATKLVPLAEGRDARGCVRTAASLSGVFSFKPTFGLVPYHHNESNVFGSVHPYMHHGPIARSAADAALLFSVMIGYDVDNPHSVPSASVDYVELAEDVKGLKVAYIRNFGLSTLPRDEGSCIAAAIENITSLGCEVEEVPLNIGISFEDYVRLFSKLWCVHYAVYFGKHFDQNPEQYSEREAQMIESGRHVSALEFRELELQRSHIWRSIQSLLHDYNLIVSPTMMNTTLDNPLTVVTDQNNDIQSIARHGMIPELFNLTGHPSATLPVGVTDQRIPVGLHIASNRFADRLIFQLCHHYESSYETYVEPSL